VLRNRCAFAGMGLEFFISGCPQFWIQCTCTLRIRVLSNGVQSFQNIYQRINLMQWLRRSSKYCTATTASIRVRYHRTESRAFVNGVMDACIKLGEEHATLVYPLTRQGPLPSSLILTTGFNWIFILTQLFRLVDSYR